MNTFLPQDYKVPSNPSAYTKLAQGNNKFRILNSPITGWQYFTTDNKVVRSKDRFAETPNIANDRKQEHFWAMPIYNYETKQLEILTLTQKTIMNTIEAYSNNPDWGNPMQYDITINKKGEKLTTEYNVIPSPAKEMSDEVKAAIKPLNLEALYTGGNPFDVTETVSSVAADIEQAF